jgi:DNA (cytosine-5)-methyltransferase 1
MSSKWSKGSSGPAGDEVANLVAMTGGGFDVRFALPICETENEHAVPVAIQERAISENPNSGPDGAGIRQDGAAYTLEARTVPQAGAFSAKDHGGDAMDDCSPTLRAGGHAGSHANADVMPAVAFDLNQITSQTNRSQPDPAVHHTLPATSCPPHLALPWAVRRLTPGECEKLQGFPPGWTDVEYRGKQAADGPRYKALGNSMAVNVMNLIFERIREVDQR